MPLLPKQGYTAQIGDAPLSGGRRATAQDFSSSDSGMIEAGHRISATATGYLNDMEEKEARTALIASTEVRAQYAKRLDEAALSGADLGKLKEEMVTALGKIGEQFQTKKGDDQLRLYTANSEIMYDQQANSIAVQRAWSTARLDGQKFVNGASALIQSNPAYLAMAEKDAVDFVATFPGIRPDQRAELTDRLTKDLNMAGAMSAARLDPLSAKAKLEAGEWNLTPEQRQTALSRADSFNEARRTADALETANKRREKEERKDQAETDLTRRIFAGETGKKIYNEITTNPDLDAGALRRVQATLEQRTKDLQGGEATAKTDPAVFNNLRALIDLPATDPRKPKNSGEIWAAYGKGLSKADADWLERRLRDNRSEAGQRWAAAEEEVIGNLRPQLDRSTLLSMDAGGGARVQAFTQYLRDKVNEYRDAKKDPYDLLNPNNKDYVGNAIPLFQSGAQRKSSTMTDTMNRALDPKDGTARLPGETPAEYLKRRGLK